MRYRLATIIASAIIIAPLLPHRHSRPAAAEVAARSRRIARAGKVYDKKSKKCVVQRGGVDRRRQPLCDRPPACAAGRL